MSSALPIHRHFDCMKRCPMECSKACKRLAYPKLVEALRATAGRFPADTVGAFADARALLRELGEES